MSLKFVEGSQFEETLFALRQYKFEMKAINNHGMFEDREDLIKLVSKQYSEKRDKLIQLIQLGLID